MNTEQVITKESLAKFMQDQSKVSYTSDHKGNKNYAYSEADLLHLAGEVLSIIQIHTTVKINTKA